MSPAQLAGRGRELGAVLDVMTGADAGTPVLVVAGEAGIGKSRLAAAAAEAARAQGVLVLQGWCLSLREDLPFLPIVDVLCQLGEVEDGRLLKSVLAGSPPYVRDEVATLLPELIDRDERASLHGGGSGDRRQRLFSALTRLLRELAEATPTAVVIEDVHWADPSTQDLVRYLAVPSHRTGVPIVVTTRLEDGVDDWLRDLPGVDPPRRVDLGPLDRADTGRLVAAIGLHAPGAINRIHARSGGHPLFAQQLAVSGELDGGALPASLSVLLQRRLRRLTPIETDVARMLAVSGRPLDDVVLAHLTGRQPPDIALAVRSLAAQLITCAVPGKRHSLRHALLAEAVLEQMTRAEAQTAHRRVAVALALSADESASADVAAHFAAAGDEQAEAWWRLRAARYADSVSAPFEAAEHWVRLVQLFRQAGTAAPVVDVTAVDVCLAAVAALERSGRGRGACDLAADAVEQMLATLEPHDQVRLLAVAGYLRAAFVDIAAGIAALEHAAALGAELAPDLAYVEALHRLAQMYNLRSHGDYDRQQKTLHRALAAARTAQLRTQEKVITMALAWRAMAQGDRDEALDFLEQALSIRCDPPDRQAEVLIGVYATDVLLKLGDLPRVAEIGLPALTDARRHGYHLSFESDLLLCNVMESFRERGRCAEAEGLAGEIAEDEPLTAGTALVRSELAAAYCARGDFDAASRFWDGASLHEWSLSYSREFALTGGEFRLWQGRAAEAVAAAWRVLEPLASTEESAESAGLFVLALRACADLCDARGEVALQARRDAARLKALLDSCPRFPFADGAFPLGAQAHEVSWRAEWARCHDANDASLWARTAQAWTRAGRPHRAAYAAWRQAEALLADPRGRPEATPVLVAAAVAAHGHVPLTTAIHDLAGRAHIELPDGNPGPLAAAQPVRPFGLTPKEAEILRLLSRGLTNGEIGGQLFISAKTVSVHVSSILRKLGVTSRVQAAAVAIRADLDGAAGQ